MKTEYVYNVKLDYEPGISDPGKVFIAYSEIIKSFKRIDGLLGRTLNHSSVCKQTLESVKLGSFTSAIKSVFEYPDSDLTDQVEYTDENVQTYLSESTASIFKALEKGVINSEKQIESIQNEIEENAQKQNIKPSFPYSKPSVSEIVDVLKDVSESVNTLSEHESISYLTENKSIAVPKKIEVDVRKIETELTKKLLTTNRELILKIKKVCLIGNAQWEFKHGRNTIPANINDKEWLEKFHKKTVAISPGDSLEVIVELNEEYDKYGTLLNEDYTIVKVVRIIPGEIDEE